MDTRSSDTPDDLALAKRRENRVGRIQNRHDEQVIAQQRRQQQEENDELYRLVALDDGNCLINRLRLANYWLTDILADMTDTSAETSSLNGRQKEESSDGSSNNSNHSNVKPSSQEER